MLTPKLFQTDDFEQWKKFLDEQGYVVLEEILPEQERSEIYSIFLKEMNKVSPKLDLKDSETFTIENTPLMFAKGMAVFNGFGNSDFMWNLRTHPNIRKIYELLHSTEKLNVSMDGFSMFLSSEQKPGQWLHIDQNPNNSLYSIQGSYNFLPVTEDSSGFVVVPKSHLSYLPSKAPKGDFIVYDKNKTGFEDLGKQAVKLIIPKNCFVLWNSRLLHANTGIVKQNRKPKIQRFDRLTCYITYLPKNDDEKLKEKRIKAYLKGETTSHWANKCEIKRYPWGFGPRYEKRGFDKISPKLEEGKIPKDRFELL